MEKWLLENRRKETIFYNHPVQAHIRIPYCAFFSRYQTECNAKIPLTLHYTKCPPIEDLHSFYRHCPIENIIISMLPFADVIRVDVGRGKWLSMFYIRCSITPFIHIPPPPLENL